MSSLEQFVSNLQKMVYVNINEESVVIKRSAKIDNAVHNIYLTSTHTFTPELKSVLQPTLNDIVKSQVFINALKKIAGRNVTNPVLLSSFRQDDIYDINLLFGTQKD